MYLNLLCTSALATCCCTVTVTVLQMFVVGQGHVLGKPRVSVKVCQTPLAVCCCGLRQHTLSSAPRHAFQAQLTHASYITAASIVK